ncbi:sodium/glutamate symporter [Shewanella sp. KX20019]|uniref:sodium/glutamate symporter n=1 Tax=Shewanella sp. KX20019 TaxID=2803864 RepID=UPI00192774E9|nr:sodium/glutamate symporter [Shewanella sp. KX20019]QQX81297.1 sodium/glutamate symporter [Shewanella sp. KX20019]
MQLEIVDVSPFVAFTLAIMVLFYGKYLTTKYELLRKYSIPEPVVGGFACAVLVGVLYYFFGYQLNFELDVMEWLLVYFFTGIGLRADIKTLLKGGKPLLFLLLLASSYIVMQNILGVSVASLFGLDPKAGLMSGSVALTGGVGTTMAWAPTFVSELGIANATELGVASNTLGLIGACCIGGPIAAYLIKRHKLEVSASDDLTIGTTHTAETAGISVTYFGVLRAWLWLNVSMMLGYSINETLQAAGVKLPLFVACLLAGILVGNFGRWALGRLNRPRLHNYAEEAERGLTLISDLCLGMFLTMALMSLQIWKLEGSFVYICTIVGLQILMSALFTTFVVFRVMGKDYGAAVICAGFGGVTLGSTATAIVNMQAVTQQYGAARQAFIVVPLVCGFFIDIVNAMVINFMVYF